jgi:hypothetical protein
MKGFVSFIIILLISIPACRPLTAQSNPPKVIAKFSAASLKWIHAAEPEFQRRKLDLDRYTVVIADQNDSVTVTLTALDSIEGARGSSGKYREYEVEIIKKDLKIVRSNYIR